MAQYSGSFTPNFLATGKTFISGPDMGGTLTDAYTALNRDQLGATALTTTWPTGTPALIKNIYVRNFRQSPSRVILERGPNMRKEVYWGPKIFWKERDMMPVTDTCSGSVAAGTTLTITPGNVAMWQVNDVCQSFSPRFQGIVTAVSTTITVVCESGNQPSTPLSASTKLHRFGSARTDLGIPYTAARVQEVQVDNCMVRPEDFLLLSKWELNSPEDFKLPVGGRLEGEMAMLEERHLTGNELLCMFGMKVTTTTNSRFQGVCNGFYNRTSTHVWDAATTAASENSVEDFVNDFGAEPGDGEIYAFSGRNFLKTVGGFAMGKLEINNQLEERYGMTLRKYVSRTGVVINLVPYPLFTELGIDGTVQFVRMNPDAISLVRHQELPETRREDAIVPWAQDAIFAGYRSAFTLKLADEKSHLARIINLGSPTIS